MQGDRCFDGLDTVWRKAVHKIKGLNEIVLANDGGSSEPSSDIGEGSTRMDCESQEGENTNEDDESATTIDDDKK